MKYQKKIVQIQINNKSNSNKNWKFTKKQFTIFEGGLENYEVSSDEEKKEINNIETREKVYTTKDNIKLKILESDLAPKNEITDITSSFDKKYKNKFY